MLGKNQEEPVKQEQHLPGNRIKLPEESGIRTVTGFKEFLAMAETSKGSQIELSWTTKIPGQRFVLDMQWEPSQKAPFWTLYEQNNGKSKRIWDEPFTIANVDMCYDVLVMTCGAVDHSTKNLAEILKSQPEKIDWSKPASKPAVSPNELASGQTTNDNGSTSSVLEPNIQSIPLPANAANGFPNASQNPNFPPGYGFPPGMAPMPMNPAMGFPVPPYNIQQVMTPPNMPASTPVYPTNMNNVSSGFPLPQSMPANQMPANQMPANQMPANTWQYNSGGGITYDQTNSLASAMQNISGRNLTLQGESLTNAGALSNLPMDSAFFNKQKGISFVDLLIKAELITENTLAATLKIQELIQTGILSSEKGVEILKREHNKGNNIQSYIIENSATNKNNPPENLAAFNLLIQSGLASDDDIKLARAVTKKHGGDIVAVLQAAQKLDARTFEAAQICHDLQKNGQMKLEQSVIVLNYCNRSRVSFDEALSELKWPNPRKQQAAQ